MKQNNDFKDEQLELMIKPSSKLQHSDLIQLEIFDYFIKIYEVRMEVYGKFLNVVPYVVLTTAITFVVGILVYLNLASLFLFCFGPWLFHPWHENGIHDYDLVMQTFWIYFCTIP